MVSEATESGIASSTALQRRREFLAAALVLTLATLSCFHELLLHPGRVLVGPQKRGHNDLTDYFIGNREYAAAAIRDCGTLPYWNPHAALGLPHTGNPQAALWYPPNWLTLVWHAAGSLSWLLAAHHLFGGLGIYCLGRRSGLSWSAATLGGVVFLGAPFLIAQAAEGHYPQIAAVSWTPWTLLAYASLREKTLGVAEVVRLQPTATGLNSHEFRYDDSSRSSRPNPLADVAPLALCLAMSFLAGHAQETYYLVLILSGCLLADCVVSWRAGQQAAARRLLLNWLRLGMVTAGLVAIDLFPAYLNTRLTLRPSLRQMNMQSGVAGLDWSSLSELWNPFAVTQPEDSRATALPFWEKLCHFGVLPLLLAALALPLAWRKAPTRRMFVIWLATLLFAFGSLTPVYQSLAAVVPGISWFRHPSRALFFTSFATAVLAAVAVDELIRMVRRRRPETRWPTAVIAVALLSACILELARFADAVTTTAAVQSLADRDPELLRALTDGTTPTEMQRVLAIQEVISDRDAAEHGLYKLQGYEPAGPAAYLLLMAQLSESPERPVEPMGFLPADVRHLNHKLLDLLAVRHAVQLREPNAVAAAPPGWQLVRSGEVLESVRRTDSPRGLRYSYDLLKNPTALPRAFVIGDVRELNGATDLASELPTLDFRKQVLLDRDVLSDGPRAQFQPARITRDAANSIELVAELDAPGYLVLSDLWYPGWTAHSGDRVIPILKANGAFRAVPLPAGRHHVVMSYRPRGFLPGAVMSLATLLGLGVVMFTGRTRRVQDARSDRIHAVRVQQRSRVLAAPR